MNLFGEKEEKEKETVQKNKSFLFDFIKDINHEKKYIINENNEKDYVPYVVNKNFSSFPDTLFYAQTMNINHNLSNVMQYDYLFHSIKSRKRFKDDIWKKKNNEEKELYEIIEFLGNISNISFDKAKDYFNLLDDSKKTELKEYKNFMNNNK